MVGQACAPGATLEGVDVSSYQGTIDWTAVKASGRAFAFIRLADGTSGDSHFAQNWAAAKAAGLTVGAYQYFRPTHDVGQQVAFFQSQLASVGGLQPGDLPPVVDVETLDGAGGSAVAQAVAAWVAGISQALSVRPLVYSSPSFWNALPKIGIEANADLWIAQWTSAACPNLPGAWTSWKFWQYSSTGQVPGISGGVDLDRFNGSALPKASSGMGFADVVAASAGAAGVVGLLWAYFATRHG